MSSWITPDTLCQWRESYWLCLGFSRSGWFRRCRNYSCVGFNGSSEDKGNRNKDGVSCFTWSINKKKLDTYNPVKKIFNIMSYSVELRWKKNLEGYACPDSASGALKIWYIADAWQRLVAGDWSPQSTVWSMMTHRMTQCKEMTNLPSRAGFGSS